MVSFPASPSSHIYAKACGDFQKKISIKIGLDLPYQKLSRCMGSLMGEKWNFGIFSVIASLFTGLIIFILFRKNRALTSMIGLIPVPGAEAEKFVFYDLENGESKVKLQGLSVLEIILIVLLAKILLTVFIYVIYKIWLRKSGSKLQLVFSNKKGSARVTLLQTPLTFKLFHIFCPEGQFKNFRLQGGIKKLLCWDYINLTVVNTLDKSVNGIENQIFFFGLFFNC